MTLLPEHPLDGNYVTVGWNGPRFSFYGREWSREVHFVDPVINYPVSTTLPIDRAHILWTHRDGERPKGDLYAVRDICGAEELVHVSRLVKRVFEGVDILDNSTVAAA